MKTSAMLAVALGFATCAALAGESPYNPNAQAQPLQYYYYVCVATSRDFKTRYVSSMGASPKPCKRDTIGTISQDWSQYLAQTVGANKVMNAHCNEGPGEKQMQDYRQSELQGKSPSVVPVEWHYGQAAQAAGAQ